MGPSSSIVFLNRFYWPDVAATGQMLTDLAEHLAERGWEVTVITSRGSYNGGTSVLAREQWHNGVRVIRVPSTRFGRHRYVTRIGDYASYLWGALWRLLRVPRPEIVVAMSDPPFLVALAVAAGRIRGSRVVYWVQDLYPDLAMRLGVFNDGALMYRAAARFARRLHAACDAVITVGPNMSATVIARGATARRTTHVHNWADTDTVKPIPAESNPFVLEHGLQGKFVVLYSGNAGRSHEFGAIVEAMRRLRYDTGVLFIFVGGGRSMAEIQAAAETDGLPNVRFLDYLPRSHLPYSLPSASVSLVSESPAVIGLLLPSKTYGILASGRPLIFIGSERSDVAEIVREAGCGFVVAPDDPSSLVASIRLLKENPGTVQAMGARAREAAERQYSRRRGTLEWEQALVRLLDGGN